MEGLEVTVKQNEALVEVEQQRAIAETQAALIIAKRFPRNIVNAQDKIINACTRVGLAETALYEYSRGGTNITGPSIRLAETIAQNWGNVQFGIRELEQRQGNSTIEAFAWDVETNTKQVKIFQVAHKRHTKKGVYALDDPRDIYEMTANQGARRLRACILGIIPGDIVEAATRQCELTMKTKVDATPQRIAALIEKFSEFNVTKAQIEKKIQRHVESITPGQMVNLGKIYNSLKDGMSASADWFEVAEKESKPETEATEKIHSAHEAKKAKKGGGHPPEEMNPFDDLGEDPRTDQKGFAYLQKMGVLKKEISILDGNLDSYYQALSVYEAKHSPEVPEKDRPEIIKDLEKYISGRKVDGPPEG